MTDGAERTDDGEADLPGRRTAITVAHWMTISVSGLVALVALASVLFAGGPRGSQPLGLALFAVASVTVWAGWMSLSTFRETDHPRLALMGVVGFAWMGVTLIASSLGT